VPGLKVIAPSNAADAKGLLKAGHPLNVSIRWSFLENEIPLRPFLAGAQVSTTSVLPIGKAKIARAGNDVTSRRLVDLGMRYAMEAARRLAMTASRPKSSTCARLNPWTPKPSSPRSKKDRPRVTVEEGWQQNGVGAEIAARIMEHAFDYLDAPVGARVGQEVPMPYAAISKSWRCLRSPKWSRRRSPSAIVGRARCPLTS